MFSAQTIRNVLVDFAGYVSRQNFTPHHKYYTQGLTWQDSLGLDSIQIMEMAAYVHSFFHMFETDKENYLLEDDSVDNWVKKVLAARHALNLQLTFTTSGTTGHAKATMHTVAYLQREISFLATLFGGVKQIITLVPAHSIYGFIFTVLLPGKLSIPVLHASEVQWNKVDAETIIVATPFHWPMLLQSLNNCTINCYGVSATSLLVPALKKQIESKGIRLLDVYGSTETSGVGYRLQGDAYQLFPYLAFADGLSKAQVLDTADNTILPLQDELERHANNTFSIGKRIDGQVNIAGKLVDLMHVGSVIRQIDNVIACEVYAKRFLGDTHLNAHITLANNSLEATELCIQGIKKILPAHELPRHFDFE